MTTEKFITECQEYYGANYLKGQRKYILQYLEQRNERALDHLFAAVLRNFSSRYGKVPDIAAFEEVRAEVVENMKDDPRIQNLNTLAIEDKSSRDLTPEEQAEVDEGFKKLGLRFGASA